MHEVMAHTSAIVAESTSLLHPHNIVLLRAFGICMHLAFKAQFKQTFLCIFNYCSCFFVYNNIFGLRNIFEVFPKYL